MTVPMTPRLSTSGRAGNALAASAFLAGWSTLLGLSGHPFLPVNGVVLAGSVLLLALGIMLVIKDPAAKQLGWRLLIRVDSFGTMTAQGGYSLTVGAGLFLDIELLIMPGNAYYDFLFVAPYVAIAAVLYLLGWLLVLRPQVQVQRNP